jgi:hypothetical protein
MIHYYNMNLIDYNIDYSFISSKPFIITAILLFIIFFIMFVICSYFVLNFLKISIEYNNVFFYQYNKKCQKIINEYGNCKINKIYLVRQPFGKLVNLVFNILTLFNYNKYLSESEDNYPYHPALIFEIKKDNKIKFLLLEKNNCINICETFLINKSYDFKKVSISKNNFTLNKILKVTQKRIGNHKFFNWNIYKNNCQEFTKEILTTLNVCNKEYKDFILKDKIIKEHYEPSDFTLHIVNCLFIIINFTEKYVLDNNIFY